MKALAAEVVQKFSSRLKYLGVVVSELTGDMQMTKVFLFLFLFFSFLFFFFLHFPSNKI